MIEAFAAYLLVTFVFYQLDPNPAPEGYTASDPCFRCGENWEFYPPSQVGTINNSGVLLPQKQTME